MTHQSESPNPESNDKALRNKHKAEPQRPSSNGSAERSTDSASHRGAVGGALIGEAVGGGPGLVSGALLGSVLDEDDSE